MAVASLLFPVMCLLISFAFTICLYHSSIAYAFQECQRYTHHLGWRARRKVFRRHPRRHEVNSRGKLIGEPYDVVPSPDTDLEGESRLAETMIPTDHSFSWGSEPTMSDSDVSIIFSDTESEEERGQNINEEPTQNHQRGSNGLPRYTVLKKHGEFKDSQRASSTIPPSPISAPRTSLNMSRPKPSAVNNNHEIPNPPLQLPVLPEWGQALQHRMHGHTPGALLDGMVDWAVRHFQKWIESDTADSEFTIARAQN